MLSILLRVSGGEGTVPVGGQAANGIARFVCFNIKISSISNTYSWDRG